MTKEQTPKQIQMQATDMIKWHSLIKKLPRWADDSPEMESLKKDIEMRGIDQPLIVCATDGGGETPGYYYLLDGRHRHTAAKLAGKERVPVVVCKESDALGIILGSITQRRHFSKGALAYLCYPVIAAAALPKEIYLKKGPKSTESTTGNVEELCARLGFSRDLYFQAKRVHEVFAQYPEMKERFEPAILSGESGIGAVLAGIGSSLITKGQPRNETNFLSWDAEGEDLGGKMPKMLDTFRKGFSQWDGYDPVAKAAFVSKWREFVSELPEELLAAVARRKAGY